MQFPFLAIFIIFLLFLAYRYRQLSKTNKDKQADFWDRELKANATSARDLSDLSYITIPLEKFPLDFSNAPDILELERSLRDLSNEKIINLTGVSNTEIKETYGVPNFNTVTKMGEKYDELTTLLVKYAKALLDANHLTDAIGVLEYGVVLHTDVSSNYTLLAQCYSELNQPKKIDYLMDQVKASNLYTKATILRQLEEIASIKSDNKPTEDFDLSQE